MLWRQGAIVFGLILGACDPKVTEESCEDDEVYVEDYCVECGNAGGCDRTGPACLEACTDTGYDCIDGARWPTLCD